jgi:hypothetical protein
MTIPGGRSGRTLLLSAALALAACLLVLVPSAGASASTPSGAQGGNAFSPGVHLAVGPNLSCPGSNAICFYDSQNFNNLLGYVVPGTCSGIFPLDPFRNKTESVRNRTGCRAYLLYFVGNSVTYDEWMRPFAEDGTISPLNAIDEVAFALP